MDSSTIVMIVAAIVFMVIPSLKDRVIPVRQLILAPAIFFYFFSQSLKENFHLNVVNNLVMIVGICIGVAIGILIRKSTKMTADKNASLIALPGTYLNLILFSLIFMTHFIVGYLKAVQPAIFIDTNLISTVLIFLLACVSSVSFGGNACLYIKYRTMPSIALQR